MPVQRIVGLETEYGIMDSEQGAKDLHESSAAVVEAYRAAAPYPGVRWDYSGESPLHDARGFEVAREYADPSLLTDNPLQAAPSAEDHPGSDHEGTALPAGTIDELAAAADGNPETGHPYRRPIQRKVIPTEVVRLTPWEERFQRGHNMALANGGRLYVDHSHPEYSTPEVTSPTAALQWDWAGDQMLAAACKEKAPHLRLFKNNTDGKAVSYGCHENYRVERKIDFEHLRKIMVPFLVTRPLLVGAGRLGKGDGTTTPQAGFQISQRADFIDREVGLHTTVNRPIINTRDEPHADPERWRRFHVIVGDANRVPAATWLKVAITSLVLSVIEAEADQEWENLTLTDPVAAVTQVSYDLLGTEKLALADGRQLRAAEIQRAYWRRCAEWEAAQAAKQGQEIDPETARALQLWDELLTVLEVPAADSAARLTQLAPIADRVEWVARWQLLSALQQRKQIPWDSPVLLAADLQWSEITGNGGFAGAFLGKGTIRPATDWVTAAALKAAETHPPENTRAWFRGTLIRRFPTLVTAASWHSIVLDDGVEYLKRLPITEVTEWTAAVCAETVNQAEEMSQVTAVFAKTPRKHPGQTYGNMWY